MDIYTDYLEKREWEEVPVWRALKVWANNRTLIKCVLGNRNSYYSGFSPLKEIDHNQVINGKWFIELK